MAGTMVTRTYGNFRGVDFANRTPDLTRSPDAVNLWKNYMNEGKSVETRPLLTKVHQLLISNHVGIFRYYTPSHTGQKEYILFCNSYIPTGDSTRRLEVRYKYLNSENEYVWGAFFIFDEIENLKTINAVQIDEILYITTGLYYVAVFANANDNLLSKSNISVANQSNTIQGYIPTTSTARKPEGGGYSPYDSDPHGAQYVNLLSMYRKNTFIADGTSTDYYLDTESATSISEVKVNGTTVSSGYSLQSNKYIHFNTAPSAPATEGQANVEITYAVNTNNADKINHCTLCLSFDDRVFFSGNPDYPNVIFYSALDDPTYVPEVNWTKAGTDVSPVVSLVNGNNSLWAFKESNPNETTIFYYVPATNPDTGATYYYAQNSTILKGCESTAKNFNDDIVMFTKDGLEGVNNDLQSEQVLGMRSSMVNSKLLNETRYKDLACAVWQNYLVVGVGQHIYLADSRQRFQNEAGTMEYEWFYWDMSTELATGEYITVMANINDTLYIGTDRRIYSLTDTTSNVTAYWTTPMDDLGYPSYRKVSNKRGCTMRMKGTEVQIQAKMDAGEFSNIATYTNTKGYIVPRIKLKKWKEVQFKFTSDKRFGVYDMTMEFYVGGYVKR